MLAHKAEDEGALVSEYLASGKEPHLDYNAATPPREGGEP